MEKCCTMTTVSKLLNWMPGFHLGEGGARGGICPTPPPLDLKCPLFGFKQIRDQAIYESEILIQ